MSRDKNTKVRLTMPQSICIGLGSGLSSSVINHPFQVLRARFQNGVANPGKGLKVFPQNPLMLFRGFPATLLSMWSLTITQALSRQLPANKNDFLTNCLTPIIGGYLSAMITTPLEGAIIRQNKTTEKRAKVPTTYETTRLFYQQYGLGRSYSGFSLIGLRTSIVGSAFSIWMPLLSKKIEQQGVSSHYSALLSGALIGTLFAAISQPAESLRIEQQFAADGGYAMTIRQAYQQLVNEGGIQRLFKGGHYRIPRTAPGIFINAIVFDRMTSFFAGINNTRPFGI